MTDTTYTKIKRYSLVYIKMVERKLKKVNNYMYTIKHIITRTIYFTDSRIDTIHYIIQLKKGVLIIYNSVNL